jgi:HSP20 family molecular chaperone IbpA
VQQDEQIEAFVPVLNADVLDTPLEYHVKISAPQLYAANINVYCEGRTITLRADASMALEVVDGSRVQAPIRMVEGAFQGVIKSSTKRC